MKYRRRTMPQSARAAGRAVKLLGVFGGVNLFLVCMVVAVAAIGAKVTGTADGQAACELPPRAGGPGVEVFGDSTLLGLAGKLPRSLAGGQIADDVKAGRTAQQVETILNSLPDSAPNIIVVSLADDDASSNTAYTDRIDALMVILSGRTVYWITAPGKSAYTDIVNAENVSDPGDPETQSGWQIVDFAASVRQHPQWWGVGRPSAAGLTSLAKVITSYVSAAGDSADPTTDPTSGKSDITVTSTSTSGDNFRLAGEALTNARAIVSVGDGMGVPTRAKVIAVATAIQESKLINITTGPTVFGIFQQTPPGWGTIAEVEDPAHAATSFYTRLLTVPGWQQMDLADAAEAVQISGLPQYYAQWEQSADVIVAALNGQHAAGCGPQFTVPGNPRAQIAVNAALSQVGVPYSFAGGNLDGPTLGTCEPGTDGYNDCHIVGFDCSGLMLYAWGQAGVTVPHFTGAMWTDHDFTHIAGKTQFQPGDMLMFESPPGHTGMYLGNGRLVDAPHSGSVVKVESMTDPWYAQNYVGALRPKV